MYVGTSYVAFKVVNPPASTTSTDGYGSGFGKFPINAFTAQRMNTSIADGTTRNANFNQSVAACRIPTSMKNYARWRAMRTCPGKATATRFPGHMPVVRFGSAIVTSGSKCITAEKRLRSIREHRVNTKSSPYRNIITESRWVHVDH